MTLHGCIASPSGMCVMVLGKTTSAVMSHSYWLFCMSIWTKKELLHKGNAGFCIVLE
jgi:hypothetical protein